MATTMNTYYLKDMVDNIFDHVKAGRTVHLQWKCMGCGDKITADDPISLTLDSAGNEGVAVHRAYLHTARDNEEFCGISTPITAKAFNFMVMMVLR